MATEQEIKNMRKTLDNKILRKQILGLNKKKSMQKLAKNQISIDEDFNEFQVNFLKNWNKLENVPEVWEEIKNLSEQEAEDKKDKLKNKFAETLITSEGYKQGYAHAERNKQYWKNKFKSKSKSK